MLILITFKINLGKAGWISLTVLPMRLWHCYLLGNNGECHKLGVWDYSIHATMYKLGTQQGPTV